MNNNSTSILEEKLSNILRPVSPNPEFLNSLKSKLTHAPSIVLESSKKSIGLIVIGAGLVAGALTIGIINLIKKSKSDPSHSG